ncbi:hypothetical protein B0H14DRAFT_1581764 [Mycena olivaceomarginata]|nr:hypothetical protein B0H14DRAFT_1581764 [Mycena olivaceomarginata]
MFDALTTVQNLPDTQNVILLCRMISLILCSVTSRSWHFSFVSGTAKIIHLSFRLTFMSSHAAFFAGDELKSTRYPVRGQDPEVGKHSDNPTVEGSSRDYGEHNSPSMDLFLLFSMAFVGCALITALSEFLVSSLSNLASGSMFAKEWLGMILIPLAGTFARHDLLEAIHYGQKDALSDSLALSMGPSVNLVLFIQPTLVLVAWIMKDVPLLYDSFESLTLFLSVLVVNLCLGSGKNGWLSGVALISLYALIGTTFWFYVSFPMLCCRSII